jgi:hypothetical protein
MATDPQNTAASQDRRRRRTRLAGHIVAFWAIISWPLGYLWSTLFAPAGSWQKWGNTAHPPLTILLSVLLFPAIGALASCLIGALALRSRLRCALLESLLGLASSLVLLAVLHFLVVMAFWE